MQPRQRSKCVTISGEIVSTLLVADPHQHDAPARRVHLVLEDGVARARRQAEAAVHAVPDQVQLGRVRARVPGGAHSPPTKAPGRKIRAGSKRAFRRSITTCAGPASGHWSRDPGGAVEHRAGARRERLACRRDALGVAGANAIHDSPSAARETTVAVAGARGSRSAGRSGGRRPSARRRRARCSARTASQSTSASVADAARPARARDAPENCTRMRPAPSCPDDVEAVGLQRPPRELEHRAPAARPGRRGSTPPSRSARAAGAAARRPTRSARASRTSPRTASPGHSPRRS